MANLGPAKTTAASYLDEIEATLSVRKAFNDIIVARQGLLFPALQHDAQAKASLQEALRAKDTDDSALNRGLVIQVISVFELFIRSLIAAVSDHISGTIPKFSKVDKRIQNQFLAHAGRIMNYIPSGSVSGQNFDFEALLKSVRMCLADDSPYQIHAPAFSVLMGNCTPKKLKEIFGILGLDEPFSDEIGRSTDLQRVLNERGFRRVASSARKTLDDQIDLRNDIVHGQLIRAVSSDDVQFSVSFFRALIVALSEAVERKLNA